MLKLQDADVTDVVPEGAPDVAALITNQWVDERPDLDFRWGISLSRIWRISAMAQAEREARAREFGCSAGDMTLLVTLRRGGAPYEARPEDLRRACVVTSGAITGRIARLQKLGYVMREACPKDLRSFRIRLTPAGLKVTDAAISKSAVSSSYRHAHAALSERERQTLDGLLERLHNAMEELGGRNPPRLLHRKPRSRGD